MRSTTRMSQAHRSFTILRKKTALLRGMTCLILFFLSSVVAGQSPTTLDPSTRAVQTPTSGDRPSVSHLYWHFMRMQKYLDDTAASREKEGKDGRAVREHLQKKLGFSSTQFTHVREVAKKLDEETTAIDSKAKQLIATDRLHHPAGEKYEEPQLKVLAKEREDSINRAISELDNRLGDEDSKKLRNFLENEFFRSVTVRKIHPRVHTLEGTSGKAGDEVHQ
jgi:hypothetical protein